MTYPVHGIIVAEVAAMMPNDENLDSVVHQPPHPPSISVPTPPRATGYAVGGLLVALVAPLIPVGHWIAPGGTLGAMLAREAVWWFYAVALLVWLLKAEKLPLRSIGLRLPTGKTIAFGLLGFVALLAVFVVHFAVLIPKLHLDPSGAAAQRNVILATPYWFRVLLVLRAAVVEEIIFRGYLIEKVRQVVGNTVVAVLVSITAFTLAHLSGWGAVHLIPVFGTAVVLALLYVWKRDLGSNMIAHFLIDGMGFLLG